MARLFAQEASRVNFLRINERRKLRQSRRRRGSRISLARSFSFAKIRSIAIAVNALEKALNSRVREKLLERLPSLRDKATRLPRNWREGLCFKNEESANKSSGGTMLLKVSNCPALLLSASLAAPNRREAVFHSGRPN